MEERPDGTSILTITMEEARKLAAAAAAFASMALFTQ